MNFSSPNESTKPTSPTNAIAADYAKYGALVGAIGGGLRGAVKTALDGGSADEVAGNTLLNAAIGSAAVGGAGAIYGKFFSENDAKHEAALLAHALNKANEEKLAKEAKKAEQVKQVKEKTPAERYMELHGGTVNKTSETKDKVGK